MREQQKLSKKILSFILTSVMVFMMIPTTVLAKEISSNTNGITECHPVHDDNCSYIEDVEGALCTHECDICKPKDSSELEQTCTCDPIIEDESKHTSIECPFYENNTTEAALFSSDGNAYFTEQEADEKLGPKLVSQNIYLSSKSGNDSNDGSSSKPVKTFGKAFELVEAGGTIWLSGNGVIQVTDEQIWGSPEKPGVTVKRASGNVGTMFIIQATGKVTLKNITVDGANRDANGNVLADKPGQFAFMVSGTLVMDSGSVVENNFSTTNGGAISVYGTLSLQGDAAIRNNKTVPGKGGGVFGAAGSTITVSDSASITGNSGSSGGIYSLGDVNISGGTISDNTAILDGGGIGMSDTGSLRISGGTISNNNAKQYGGGIYCGGSSSKISGAIIGNNSAVKFGGGIYYDNVSINTDAFSIGDCTLEGNTAGGIGLPEWGKGNNVYVYDNHLLVEGNALSGGGVFLYLNNAESKLIFKNAPGDVSLEGIKAGGSKPISGTVVAEGDGYNFVQDDLTKFTYGDEGYTFALDTNNNQIKMRDLYTVTFNVNGGDSSDFTQKITSGDKVIKPIDPTKTGYTFDGWYAGNMLFDFENIPITADITLKAKWTDKTAPLAEISLGENHWNKFLNAVTFDLFFKDTQFVTIAASDVGSGVNSVEYYIANAEVEDISTIEWASYSDGFSIRPNNEYVIYARITDNTGNVTVINSEGLIFDDISPIITGAENQEVYCMSRELTIAENYLDTVTVNGEKAIVTNGKITVSSKDTAQTIVATDMSGNSAKVTITVNASHTPNKDDGDCTTAILCSVCKEITMAVNAHDFTGAWEADSSNHWHECNNSGCTQTNDITAHTPNEDDEDCTTAVHCSACDHITTAAKSQHTLVAWQKDETNHWKNCTNSICAHIEQSAAHTWNGGTETTPPTHTQNGIKTFTCTTCAKTKTESIAAIGHTWSVEWSKDVNGHWHECTANDGGIKDMAAHSFGEWIIDTSATETTAGSKHRACSTCSYEETVTIPILSHTHTPSSEWSKDVDMHWHNCVANDGERMNIAAHTWNGGKITAPATITQEGLKTYTCTVCSQTKAEVIPKLPSNTAIVDDSTGIRVEHENGAPFDSSIVLSVISKPQEEMDKFKDSVNKVALGLTLGGLYDVKLLKDGVAIQPDGKIMVSIALTDAMKAMSNLQIIYIDNNGNITILPSEVKGDMITFITDHFSDYGVIGKVKDPDSENTSDENNSNSNDDSPQTGDNSSMLLFVLMMFASGTALIYLGKRNRIFRGFKK